MLLHWLIMVNLVLWSGSAFFLQCCAMAPRGKTWDIEDIDAKIPSDFKGSGEVSSFFRKHKPLTKAHKRFYDRITRFIPSDRVYADELRPGIFLRTTPPSGGRGRKETRAGRKQAKKSWKKSQNSNLAIFDPPLSKLFRPARLCWAVKILLPLLHIVCVCPSCTLSPRDLL